MIKISVIKNDQVVQNALFENQQQADVWINMLHDTAAWGKPERWVTEEQEDISEALDSREVGAFPEQIITEYKLASEYTILQEDISAQIAKEISVMGGKRRQELGADIIAQVYAINESKNISAENFQALMSDSNLERIERLLWTGSLKTAKLMIQALDNTYFTAEEKQSILNLLADY